MKHLLAAAMLVLPLAFVGFPAQADETDGIDCNNAVAQLDMNICADQDFQKADKALNTTYKQVMHGLDPATQALLRTSQRAWVQFRDAECKYLSAENEGGSIYPMVYSGCLTRLTKLRSAQLKQGNDE